MGSGNENGKANDRCVYCMATCEEQVQEIHSALYWLFIYITLRECDWKAGIVAAVAALLWYKLYV
jgi:hypothetical protein